MRTHCEASIIGISPYRIFPFVVSNLTAGSSCSIWHRTQPQRSESTERFPEEIRTNCRNGIRHFLLWGRRVRILLAFRLDCLVPQCFPMWVEKTEDATGWGCHTVEA